MCSKEAHSENDTRNPKWPNVTSHGVRHGTLRGPALWVCLRPAPWSLVRCRNSNAVVGISTASRPTTGQLIRATPPSPRVHLGNIFTQKMIILLRKVSLYIINENGLSIPLISEETRVDGEGRGTLDPVKLGRWQQAPLHTAQCVPRGEAPSRPQQGNAAGGGPRPGEKEPVMAEPGRSPLAWPTAAQRPGREARQHPALHVQGGGDSGRPSRRPQKGPRALCRVVYRTVRQRQGQ